MKNLYLTIMAAALSGMPTRAQDVLDTIYANGNKNVALFFPSPIHQAVTGAGNFVFTYNREREQCFGLLQAKQGVESNLLVITKAGNVYSYLLQYATELPRLNYFLSDRESVGSVKPLSEHHSKERANPVTAARKGSYYGRAAEYLLKLPRTFMASERQNGIRLVLEKMVYNRSEVFLVLEATNRSQIPFEVDFMNVHVTNGMKGKRSSYQRTEQTILQTYRQPKLLLNGHQYRFVMVLPKFVLGDNEKLMLELKELKGNRKLILETRL